MQDLEDLEKEMPPMQATQALSRSSRPGRAAERVNLEDVGEVMRDFSRAKHRAQQKGMRRESEDDFEEMGRAYRESVQGEGVMGFIRF